MSTLNNNPDLKVEVAFTSAASVGPTNVPSNGWTDITHRVMGFKSSRGRMYELGTMEAGTATITVDNSDGAFDPYNTSSSSISPGNVLPYRMIRVTARYPAGTGTYVPVFTGYVEKWTESFLAPNRGQVQLLCVDAIGLLSQASVPSCIESDALIGGALALYPLGDASGSTTAGNLSSYAQNALAVFPSGNGSGTGAFKFGDELGKQLGGVNSTCVTFTPQDWNNGYYLQGSVPLAGFVASGDALTVEAWVNVTSTYAPNAVIWDVVNSAGTTINCTVDGNTGQVSLNSSYINSSGVITTTTVSSSNIDVRGVDWVWLSGTVAATGSKGSAAGGGQGASATLTLTVGVQNTTSYSTFTNASKAVQTNGSSTQQYYAGVPYGGYWAGSMSNIVLWNSDQSSTAPNRFSSGCGYINPNVNKSSQHFNQILNNSGFNVLVGSSDVGLSRMQGLGYAEGKVITEALQMIADSEGGQWFVGKDGLCKLQNRDNRALRTSLELAFDEATENTGSTPPVVPYMGTVNIDLEPVYVYNDVTVAQRYGSTVRAVDAASITKYFTRTYTRDTYIMQFAPTAALAWTTAATTVGATSITVSNPSLFSINQMFIVGADDSMEQATVLSISGSTINLASGLLYPHPSSTQLSMGDSFDSQLSLLELADAANWLQFRYKDPHSRPETITVFASPLTTTWTNLLTLDISSKVSLTKRPIGAPSFTITSFIERIEHDYDVQTRAWNVMLQMSPDWNGYQYGLMDDGTGAVGVGTMSDINTPGSGTFLMAY